MSDTVRIRGLRVETRVGVADAERMHRQTVRLDVDIHADLSKPADTDELADTIDYSSAVSAVADVVQRSECKLLEHLASKVATSVSCMRGVLGVTVEVSKEPPPVSENVEAIVVRIERSS